MDMDGSIIEILAVDLNPFHLECERDTDIDKICQLESRSLASVGWHAYPQSVYPCSTHAMPPIGATSTSNPASFADFDGIHFTLGGGFSCWEDYPLELIVT